MSVQNTSPTTTDGTVNFETIANMYMSALATEATNGTSGFADLSEIAELYAQTAGEDNLLNQIEFSTLLGRIDATLGENDATLGTNLFEFDAQDGTNNGIDETKEQTAGSAGSATKSIDANGVLLNGTCAVTGAAKCTCKVTDGFANVTAFFDSLKKDNDNAGVMADGKLSVGEEDALLDNYTGTRGELKFGFGFERETNEALNLLEQALSLLDQGKTLTDEQKTIINDYIKTLTPEALDAKLITIFGTVEDGKKALGQLGVTLPGDAAEEEYMVA